MPQMTYSREDRLAARWQASLILGQMSAADVKEIAVNALAKDLLNGDVLLEDQLDSPIPEALPHDQF